MERRLVFPFAAGGSFPAAKQKACIFLTEDAGFHDLCQENGSYNTAGTERFPQQSRPVLKKPQSKKPVNRLLKEAVIIAGHSFLCSVL